MNLLFFVSSFYPQIGGVERSVYFVSRELCKLGFNVKIITQNIDNKSKNFEIFPEGFSVYRIPSIKIPKTGILQKWIWLIFHINLIAKSHIIHFHDYTPFVKWFLPFRFIFLKKKYFITFHGYEGFPIKFKHIFYRRLAEKLTNGNICVGEFIKRWYRTNPDKIYFAAVDYTEDSNDYSEKDIFFYGRLEKDTDITFYIQAIKLLQKKLDNKICFKIIGDGSLRKSVLNFLDENKINYEFLGFQENPTQFLKNAKIVLTSSYLSILESLSLGKIVISFYSNNLKRDYLKSFPGADSIFYVYEDPKFVASRIEDIIRNSHKYEHLKVEGKNLAKEMSWAKVAEKYVALYNKYIKK